MLARAGLAAALGVLVLAGPALAQPAGGADAERVALAGQIYAMLGRQTMESMGEVLKSSMAAPFKDSTGRDAARAQALQAALGDSVDDLMPKMMRATAKVMADDFTAEELRGMLAFYQSPTGQAVLQKMPQITQQALSLSQAMLPDFLRRLEGDYCGRVACTTQEQQVFAQMNAQLAQRAPAQH